MMSQLLGMDRRMPTAVALLMRISSRPRKDQALWSERRARSLRSLLIGAHVDAEITGLCTRAAFARRCPHACWAQISWEFGAGCTCFAPYARRGGRGPVLTSRCSV